MPKKTKFTRIPKVNDLIHRGVPAEAIPTYCALSDHANNKTGLAWPKMETLAMTLGRSVRTIQRHIHLLKEKGLIEFVERRRHKGRFSSYLYRVVHIVSSSSTSPTTGHGRRAVRRGSIYKGTKPPKNPPHSPPKEGYEWLFKEKADPKSEAQHKRARQEEHKEAARRRKAGYEWLFE